MKPRVFISSPVYDLLDVRAELEAHLSDIGFSVLMSDSAVSNFKVQTNINSIETCLVNLRESDCCIVVLSRRYGPSLAKAGYENISATHLEYREAVASKIPVHFFIRDRLEADYSIWKKNKKNSPELNWVDQNDQKIFELIDEHKTLKKKKGKNNWYYTFRSSVDLKKALSSQLGYVAKKQRLVDDISNNRVPFFACSVEVDGKPSGRIFVVHCLLKNVVRNPAFNVKGHWNAPDGSRKGLPQNPVLAPGEEIVNAIRLSRNPNESRSATFFLEYSTAEGHMVKDEFGVSFATAPDGGFKYGGRLLKKEYHIGKGDSIETMIVDPENRECD